jgi:hypothetical protein
MAKDILGQYGPESHQPQRPGASKGGITQARDVMNYRPPQGPSNINDPKGPGLHGNNLGHGQQFTIGSSSGSPGIGGTNRGMDPSENAHKD